jgi:glutamate/tyrosine decarboxylase-like PLP-dependent enzyme
MLERTFRVAAGYMPSGATHGADPYAHSMQWSRRFIGLKLFLSLAVAGWQGYEEAIRHQVAMGDRLRRGLVEHGWTVVNDTPLPVVCFERRGTPAVRMQAVAAAVVASGKAWISAVQLDGRNVLRACITNYRTGPTEVDGLLSTLDGAWAALQAPGGGNAPDAP